MQPKSKSSNTGEQRTRIGKPIAGIVPIRRPVRRSLARVPRVGLIAGLASHPHSLLLDITMPGWDGPETFVALRERGYQGPIFFMSGYATDEIAKRLAHLDLAGFVQKPISTKELIEKVGDLLPVRGRRRQATEAGKCDPVRPDGSLSDP